MENISGKASLGKHSTRASHQSISPEHLNGESHWSRLSKEAEKLEMFALTFT